MRVLVCDDDPDVGGFLSTLFGFEGWETDLVHSGQECLAHVKSDGRPDVLVLDQVMPGLTGIAVADRLRKQGFREPIILCSGHLGPELNDQIDRLALVPVNKIDLQALVRIVHVAVQKPPVMPGSTAKAAKAAKATKAAKAAKATKAAKPAKAAKAPAKAVKSAPTKKAAARKAR